MFIYIDMLYYNFSNGRAIMACRPSNGFARWYAIDFDNMAAGIDGRPLIPRSPAVFSSPSSKTMRAILLHAGRMIFRRRKCIFAHLSAHLRYTADLDINLQLLMPSDADLSYDRCRLLISAALISCRSVWRLSSISARHRAHFVEHTTSCPALAISAAAQRLSSQHTY